MRDFVIMRPPFLTNGIAKGDDRLRVGWEWGVEGVEGRLEEPGPVIGYTVSRRHVGNWIFEISSMGNCGLDTHIFLKISS